MKKRKHRKKGLKAALTTIFFGLIILACVWIADVLTTIRLPQSNKPPELYANQIRDDLRKTLVASIDSAKKSVLLIIYSLNDQSVISSLRKKGEDGVAVTVICDSKASPFAAKQLGPKVTTRKRYSRGLMHQKILVIDEDQVWIGSANMTTDSLRVHGNLLAGFHSPEVAKMVAESSEQMFLRTKSLPKRDRAFSIGGQKTELWMLPRDHEGAVDRLTQLIDSAKKTVRVAMFTWTREDMAKAVIAAKKRGVDAEVVIDHYQGNGASAKIVKMLKQGGVPTYLSQGSALLHHKFLYIDGKMLVNGSANWTKAAFTKNEDCFMILHDLTDLQKERMDHLWDVIVSEAR